MRSLSVTVLLLIGSCACMEMTQYARAEPRATLHMRSDPQEEMHREHPDRHRRGYVDIAVKVTSYCPCRRCCGRHANWKYATGRKVKTSDYAFAVSRDLERYFELNETTMFVPGYNKSGTRSTHRDRMGKGYWIRNKYGRRVRWVKIVKTVDVLMTVSKHDSRGRWRSRHRRALDWGVKRMTLRVYDDGRRELIR